MTQTLSLCQKQRLFAAYDRRKAAGESATKASLAGWAKDAFRLDRIPNQSTMSRIFKDSRDIEHPAEHRRLTDRRNRTGAAPRLDSALYKWISDLNNRGVLLSGALVRTYAIKMMQEAK